jgi:hypothetical protein
MILDGSKKQIAIKTAMDQYPGGKLRCQGKLCFGQHWWAATEPDPPGPDDRGRQIVSKIKTVVYY